MLLSALLTDHDARSPRCFPASGRADIGRAAILMPTCSQWQAPCVHISIAVTSGERCSCWGSAHTNRPVSGGSSAPGGSSGLSATLPRPEEMKLQQHSRRDFSSTHLGISIKANEAAGELENSQSQSSGGCLAPGSRGRKQCGWHQPCLPARQPSTAGTRRHSTSCSRAWKKRIPESPSADTQSLG